MKRRLGKIAAAFFVLMLATGVATQAQAQTLTVLHSFTNSTTDGANPVGGLIMDAAGNLYGTTVFGGSSNFGTVFRLYTSGNETVLHSFTGGDGKRPEAGLIMDAAGNLYGTTLFGGSSNFGTVFRFDISGNETVLHSFMGFPSDGGGPLAVLIMDAAGNLYGTTGFGQPCQCFDTVFKLDPAGNETVLYTFTSRSNGDAPAAALIRDAVGNLYSTTQFGGGSSICPTGCGTVFKLDPAGNETVLHSFAGSDGAIPRSALIMDAVGNLYGTTNFGGSGTACPNNCGTVFKLAPSGNETVLYSFKGGSDGESPVAGLIMDAAGNLYGTTVAGGSGSCASGCGTVFKLDTFGNETVLHTFTGDGAQPYAGLIMDAAGNLYGTTFNGGASGYGTVFKLSIQTPQQATQAIINPVNALFAQGVLNGGQDNSLLVKLQHAIDRMNRGNDAAAIGNLNAFIGEVNDLLSSGVLSPSQAAPLISAAQSVIARLS